MAREKIPTVRETLATVREGQKLWIANYLSEVNGKLEQATRYRVQRQQLHARIAECAEDGKIAVIESGMDCDCVRYSGMVTILPADWRAFDDHADHTARWADGPFHLSIERPSVARGVEYESRDLALEAFEDGHPHVVYA